MTKTISGNKIIVEGSEQSSMYPQNREEMLNEIFVDGRNSPFDIKGGVYSSNLTIIGPGVIKGPVFASENLHMEIIRKGTLQRYLSGLTAYKTIVANIVEDINVEDSPVGTIDGIRFIIRGDVVATEKIMLKNALVIGSLSAPSIEIENCIILGVIFCTGSPGYFRTVCSTFGIYEANKIVLEGPTTLITAGGIANSEPEFRDYISKDGVVYQFSIRLLSLCRAQQVGCGIPNAVPEFAVNSEEDIPQVLPGLSCLYWLKSECPFVKQISLCKADFIRLRCEEANMEDIWKVKISGTNDFEMDSDDTKWIFGLQNRVSFLEKTKLYEEKFKRIIHGIIAFEHLTPEQQEYERNMWDILSRDEQRLMNFATEGLETHF